MTWAGAIAQLDSLLDQVKDDQNAAFPNSDPFTRVVRGEPFSVMQRQIAYWYMGDQESHTGGPTLAKNNVDEILTIRWYWPVMNREPAWIGPVELEIREANRRTQAALLGDEHLGGQSDVLGVAIQSTSTAWQQVQDAWVRVLTIPIWIDMAWTEDIGG